MIATASMYYMMGRVWEAEVVSGNEIEESMPLEMFFAPILVDLLCFSIIGNSL